MNVLKNILSKKFRNIFCFNKKSFSIFLITIGLTAFGCVMVLSASSFSAAQKYNNEYFFLIKQIVGALLGSVALVFFAFFDYHKLAKIKWWILAISIILLVLVFIPGIGVENYGAKRWINLPGFTLQPSEIAKFAFVLFSADYLSRNYKTIKSFSKIWPVVLIGGIFCILIIAEPNMSITMCMGLVMLVMLFVGGASAKQFVMISLPIACAVPALILMEPYRIKRLVAFLDPWATPQAEGFQLIQSLYGIGSGSWFGLGLFNSRQKYLFLPFSESDFIFSVIVEELGYVGGTLLILFFVALIWLIIKTALSAKDRFGCMLCMGIAAVIAVQTLLNIAVVTGSIPPTGLPLPFISAGSTSLLVFMSAIGVVLNIDRQSRKTKI